MEILQERRMWCHAVDAEMGERIDLTIDSGSVACELPVGVAPAVGMQELNRALSRTHRCKR